MSDKPYNPALHWIALLTAAATFPLIFMGGLVTSHGAGMSVPDWPNTWGYNMFLFPPSKWVGGIFYEHTHRLMGSVVGMLSIVLAVAAWRIERRTWARRLAYSVLAAVIVQGILGGLRVVWVNLDLAIVHACVAQAFFCLASLVAVVTSRWWFLEAPDLSRSASGAAGRRLIVAGIVCVLVVYAQLIAGAMMRHYNAGLAIPDLPLAYGHVLPPVSSAGLNEINQARAAELLLPVTLWQVWLHFAHRVGAVLVSAAILVVLAMVLRRHRREISLVLNAVILAALLSTQLTLGVMTVLLKKPADIASMHVAVGALVLATSFVLTVRAMRLYSLKFRPADDMGEAALHADARREMGAAPAPRNGPAGQPVSADSINPQPLMVP